MTATPVPQHRSRLTPPRRDVWGLLVLACGVAAAPVLVPALLMVLIVGFWIVSDSGLLPAPGTPDGVTLPPGVTLVNTLRDPAGIDISYSMELSAADDSAFDALLARLTAAWQLRPADDRNRPTDFITGSSDRPPWWPATVDDLPDRHARNVGSDYWSVWADRPRRRVYVHWGNW